ncbi:hypothetical protein OROHE_004902 [Orobanche hederae]
MKKKDMAIVYLFMLLFILSYFPPTIVAVPSSRSLNSVTDISSTQQPCPCVDQIQHKGRMDVELTDYPGAGANTKHEPAPPPSGRF